MCPAGGGSGGRGGPRCHRPTSGGRARRRCRRRNRAHGTPRPRCATWRSPPRPRRARASVPAP
ncbi:hypothetical protein CBP52_12225 [Cellulomonas sp. PSBB021]|nr:hypothetical protein CBP52_12225 [Cellulomonas sp. PSBB021]